MTATDQFLSEADAHKIVRGIVTHLREMKAHVENFSIALDEQGFWFVAVINGRTISCRTTTGSFTYKGVAADMLFRALSPDTTPDPAMDLLRGITH